MQDETVRTAFTFIPILRHRTTDAARRITAVSLDTASGRVFIGLASGHVEEHEIVVKHLYADPGQTAPGGHATTRLVAEKRVSKLPITALACLPTAARLGILCEDGTASLATYETWSLVALQGVRTAVAMAADPGPAAAVAAARQPSDLVTRTSFSGGGAKPAGAAAASATQVTRPVRLAVAVKSITATAKLLVYSVVPAVGVTAGHPPTQLLAQIPLQDAVQDLIWVGAGLFVQHATCYNLLQPGGRLVKIADHGCTQPRMASAPWPGGPAALDAEGGGGGGTAAAAATGGAAAKAAAAKAARGALLFQDSLLLLTDGNGTAVVGSEPIVVSEPPLAVCSSGGFLVVVSDAEGVLVYDRASSRLVQRIFWAHDDPWVAAARRIPAAEDAAGGGGVALATSGAVMLLQPVAPDVQARELLKRKRFDAALALIRSCRRAGEVWADTALAQAGLLLLQELRCEDALAALEEVGPATFQPAQLLPLFPRVGRRWLPSLPHRTYWGLHGSLQSLDRICDDFLELRNSSSSSPRPSPSPPPGTAPGGGSGGGGAATGPSAAATAAAAAQLLLPAGASPEVSAHGHQLPLPPSHTHHQHHHQHRGHQVNHPHHHLHGPYGSVPGTHGSVEALPSPAASATGGGGGGGGLAALAADAKRHIVSYLLRNRGRPGVMCLDGIDTLLVHLLVDVRDTAALEAFLDERAVAASGSCATAGVDAAGVVVVVGNSAMMTQSMSAAASQAPGGGAGRSGSVAGAAPLTVVAVSGPPAAVSPRDTALVAALEGAGRWHALALLRAARGQVPQALELWQRLALGEVTESWSTSGAVAEAAAVAAAAAAAASAASLGEALPLPPPLDGAAAAGGGGAAGAPQTQAAGAWAAAAAAVAADAAAALMAVPARTPPLLCLSKLPWLLHSAPDKALHVLRSRPLPVADVMSLLQEREDGVRWQYLHHLVYGGSAGGQGRRLAPRPGVAHGAGGGAGGLHCRTVRPCPDGETSAGRNTDNQPRRRRRGCGDADRRHRLCDDGGGGATRRRRRRHGRH